jgi:hypothetical protein
MKFALFYRHPSEDRQITVSGGLRGKLADFASDEGDATSE